MEAWNELSCDQDLGKEDLGTFFLILCEESYPQKTDWKEAHEMSRPWMGHKVGLIRWVPFLTYGYLTCL